MLTTKKLVSAAGVMASLTLVSRILGLIRESLFGYYFSTGELLSAFRIAFQIPNLTRRMFGEGALSSAMIPVLTETLEKEGDDPSRRFVGSVLMLLSVLLIAGIVVAEILLIGWRAMQEDPALRLTAILLPYAALICVAAVASGVLHVRGHFAVPAAAPSLLNVAILMALVLGFPVLNWSGNQVMDAVCAAVLLAGAAHCAVTAWALWRAHFLPIFANSWRNPQIRRVITLMAPMALGLSAVQINTLADFLIAYLFVFENGQRVGPAVLGYAQYLYQLPLGVFGISLATAIFPLLSLHAAREELDQLAATFERGVRLALFIALPSCVGLIMVADPLVAALYQRGEFGASDTHRVAATLLFYSFGLPAYFVQHIVVRTFYSLQDSQSPARAATVFVIVNFAMNLALVFRMEERGLALATAICASLQVVWLLIRLARRLPQIQWMELGKKVAGSLASSAGMAAVLFFLCRTVHGDLPQPNPVIHLAVLVIAGVVVYAAASWMLSREEMRTLLRLRSDRS